MLNMTHETADHDFPATAYRLRTRGTAGVAYRVLGWETEAVAGYFCPDCGRSGYERDYGGGAVTEAGDPACEHPGMGWNEEPDYVRTGDVVIVMVGDDRRTAVDPADLVALDDTEYCRECGQIGCAHGAAVAQG